MFKDLLKHDVLNYLDSWTHGFKVDATSAPIDRVIIELPYNGKESLMWWLIAAIQFQCEDTEIDLTKEDVQDKIIEYINQLSITPFQTVLTPDIPEWKQQLVITEYYANCFRVTKRKVENGLYYGDNLKDIVNKFIATVLSVWVFAFIVPLEHKQKPIFLMPQGFTYKDLKEAVNNYDFYLTFIGNDEEPTVTEEDMFNE